MKNLENTDNCIYKEYLDNLRDTGQVNMLNASPYLQRDFGLSRKEARKVVLNWIKSYKPKLIQENNRYYDSL